MSAEQNNRPVENKKSFWVISFIGATYRAGSTQEAEALKNRFGMARIYEASSLEEARQLHEAFKAAVSRGEAAW